MPRPRTVSCSMCGQQFSQRSLPIHQKQCAVKMAAMAVPCEYCDQEHPRNEMAQHHRTCRAKKAQAKERARDTPHGGRGGDGFGASFAAGGGARAVATLSSRKAAPSMASGCGGGGSAAAGCAASAVAASGDPYAGIGGVVPCAVCGRSFSSDRVGRHQQICRKINGAGRKQKSRGVFDATAQRMAGIEDESGRGGGGGGGEFGWAPPLKRKGTKQKRRGAAPAPPPRKPASKWRAQRAQFLSAVRAMRGGGGGVAPDVSYGGVGGGGVDDGAARDDGFVPCQHCGRTFSAQAAERQITARQPNWLSA